jgi:hypothetical protein
MKFSLGIDWNIWNKFFIGHFDKKVNGIQMKN